MQWHDNCTEPSRWRVADKIIKPATATPRSIDLWNLSLCGRTKVFSFHFSLSVVNEDVPRTKLRTMRHHYEGKEEKLEWEEGSGIGKRWKYNAIHEQFLLHIFQIRRLGAAARLTWRQSMVNERLAVVLAGWPGPATRHDMRWEQGNWVAEVVQIGMRCRILCLHCTIRCNGHVTIQVAIFISIFNSTPGAGTEKQKVQEL